MTPGEAALMKASVGADSFTAAVRLRTSASTGPMSLTWISPTQRGRLYFAVAPVSASFFSRLGNSIRSRPGSRGVSPSKPEMRSLM